VLELVFGYINQTMHYLAGDMAKIPIKMPEDFSEKMRIETVVMECIDIAKDEWNDYETSWDFKKHPLV
jgi:hypothetical protein